MKLHYAGKYSGNPDDLPYKDHEPGAVAFKEPKSSTALAIIATVIALVIWIALNIIMSVRSGSLSISLIGILFALLTLIPHELLHAICFRDDVYFYTNLSKGILFVVGPERMSKRRFIFMSILPNFLFGFIPFVIYLFSPNWIVLGTMGAVCITMGAGDYINIFNALTQMPKGAWCYLHKFNSFWYMPKGKLGTCNES